MRVDFSRANDFRYAVLISARSLSSAPPANPLGPRRSFLLLVSLVPNVFPRTECACVKIKLHLHLHRATLRRRGNPFDASMNQRNRTTVTRRISRVYHGIVSFRYPIGLVASRAHDVSFGDASRASRSTFSSVRTDSIVRFTYRRV